jgi:hypothetical protein
MRYQARFKSRWGEVKTQLVNGESWIDAVNHVLDFQNVTEIISVKNLKEIPLSEQISLVEAKVPFERKSQPHFAQIKWG